MIASEIAGGGGAGTRKAAAAVLGASEAVSDVLVRTAHRVSFAGIRRREGYLYVRNRAISSRVNENFDFWDALEIATEEPGLGWKTFIGKPIFVNHNNANHRLTKGVNLAAALHQDYNPDGSPDTWVDTGKGGQIDQKDPDPQPHGHYEPPSVEVARVHCPGGPHPVS